MLKIPCSFMYASLNCLDGLGDFYSSTLVLVLQYINILYMLNFFKALVSKFRLEYGFFSHGFLFSVLIVWTPLMKMVIQKLPFFLWPCV